MARANWALQASSVMVSLLAETSTQAALRPEIAKKQSAASRSAARPAQVRRGVKAGLDTGLAAVLPEHAQTQSGVNRAVVRPAQARRDVKAGVTK